jgi:MoxR-like ATPase
MCAGLVERDEPARLLLLAALCGEHALLLGPPGTAKSELARRLRDCIADAAYFERLLTKFSVPEELYGPLSIKRLEQDEYHRLTEGYLPSASVAFLDEIFNANSAILNALLTLLNEREFDNGTERIATPLVSVVAASNLVPEGAELAALYDRFLFRYQVEPISDRGFELLLDQTPPQGPAVSEDCWRLTALQLEQIREQAHHIKLPDSIKMLLASLRKALVEKKLYVSDRRWTKIVHVLRVAALCDGRDRVSLVDCWLMAPCLWNRPEQAPIAEQLVRSALDAVLVDEPTRYQTIASAFEREIEADRDRREQVCSAQGQPLWYDESGAETTEPYPKTQRRNHKGELLFKAPDDMPTRGGKTDFTLEELWEDWFNARPDGLTKLEAWSHNPVNQVTV